MMPLLRRRMTMKKRAMKTGACIVLFCYCLFLLAVTWMAGEGGTLAHHPQETGHLGVLHTSTGVLPEDEPGGGGGDGAAWLPETLDRALQQQPWKLPVRRKLSRPDSQQPHVVVEEAAPGTFALRGGGGGSALEGDAPFEDLRPQKNSSLQSTEQRPMPRITDPRSLDRLLAGSPVDGRRGTPRRSDPGYVIEEDVDHDDSNNAKKKDLRKELIKVKLGTWIAPDGAVESQRDTEPDTVSSENVARKPYPQRDIRRFDKDPAARRSIDNLHTAKPVPASSRNLPGTLSKLRGKVSSAARSTDPNKAPQERKPVPVPSPNQRPEPPLGKISPRGLTAAPGPGTPPTPDPVSASAGKQPPTPLGHTPKKPAVPTMSPSSSKLQYDRLIAAAIPSPSPSSSSSSSSSASSSSSPSTNFTVSRRTANFVEIADLVIYSAFYDFRLRVPLVRMLGVGPVTRRSPVARLWCVFGSASAEPAPVWVQQSGDCRRSRRRYCFYMFHCQIPDRLQKTSSPLSNVVVVTSEGKGISSLSHPGERVRLSVILNANATTTHYAGDVTSASGSSIMHRNNVVSGSGSSIKRNNDVASASGSSISHHNDVRSASNSSTTTTFSVCVVPPLFGKLTVLQIVEFVELNRLLGANHFVFYTFRVSREVSRMLNYYEQAGVVSVMPWNIPAPNDVWNKGETVSMADCLYRSMHIFDYVVFSDVNEYFVPNQGTAWPAFMETLSVDHKKPQKTAAYEISHVKMYPNATLVSSSSSKNTIKSETSKFLTLRNTLRGTPLSANFTGTKLVLKPERVLAVDSQNGVQPISELFVSRKLDPGLASVFHFTPKVCSTQPNSSAGSVVQSCDKLSEDRALWVYKDALMERAKSVLRTLNQQADSKLT